MIKIKINTRNVDLSDSLTEYVEKKISNLDRFVQGAYENMHGDLEISKPSRHHAKGPRAFYARINLRIPKKKLIRAESYGQNARAVIDDIKHKLKIELTKYKETG